MIKSAGDRRRLIDKNFENISLTRQCELLNVSKGALYYEPRGIDPFSLELMDLIDRQFLETPFYGSRRMTAWLNRQGYPVNRKRIQRLMRLMGLETIYPRANLSRRRQDHKVYPYPPGRPFDCNKTDAYGNMFLCRAWRERQFPR